MLGVDEIRSALPERLRKAATQDVADLVNNVSPDPEAAEAIRETFIGHITILKEGRFKLEDYVHAAAYVSYKMMGNTNQESYARTFPKRYQTLVSRGASSKDISSYVAMYNKNKLVNRLMEQVMVPVWVLNQDAFQMAIKTQLDLMLNAKSEMVRMQAANSLMLHLRPPERNRVDLTVSDPRASGMDELRDAFNEMATRQREMIGQGLPTAVIAQQIFPSAGSAISPDMFVQ